jgi:exonuclease SbcC
LKIEEAGREGMCPTCERELGDELEKVLNHFDTETRELSVKLEQGLSRVRDLQSEPAALRQLQLERQKTEADLSESRKEKELASRKAVELDNCKRDLKRRQDDIAAFKQEIEKLPKGFDQKRFEELKDTGRRLKPMRDKSKELQAEVKRLPDQLARLQEEEKVLKAKEDAVTSGQKVVSELAFDPKEHEEVIQASENANQALQAATVLLERQTGELKLAQSSLAGAEAEEKAYKEKEAELKERRSRRLYLQTLEDSFERLRVELNDRTRPELEARTSALVAEMTDGRYNVVELDEQYQATIRDDGELKPIISGGEEDILNLALRLAISEMITERAGQPFSLLVLDEVFGALDDTRRDNVVTLLANLKNRFDQIILITHVESIHDMVDNCVWIEYDERTKTSRLRGSVDFAIQGELTAD